MRYKVLIFGTGSGCEKVWDLLNFEKVDVLAFLDNDVLRVGTKKYNREVLAVKDVVNLTYDYIIIASQYYKEISKQLLEFKIPRRKIIPFFKLLYSHSSNKDDYEIFKRDLFLIEKIFSLFLFEQEYNILPLEKLIGYQTQRKGVLFVNHIFGGGSKVYQDSIIEEVRKKNSVFTFNILLNHFLVLDLEKRYCFFIEVDELTQEQFNKILEYLNINLIYINQLVSFPVYKMIELIMNCKVDYLFFIHDFFCVCPSYNLINFKGKYCFAETNSSICQKCVASRLATEEVVNLKGTNLDIVEWRTKFLKLLTGAKQVLAPSKSTKDIVQKYYSQIDIKVREHKLDLDLENTFDEKNVLNHELNIAFIGNINEAKGSKIIYELKELILKEKLPINIKVIGTTTVHSKSYKSEDGILEVHGKYERKEIANLLKQYEISIVIIPSICPETFSYTTSEAIASGYPIITFNIGAPAERVKRYDAGWVLEGYSASSILSLLKKLLKDRNAIIEKSHSIKKIKEFNNNFGKRGD